MKTHLIPVNCLKEGKYDSLQDDDRLTKIKGDFEAFLFTRAGLVSLAVSRLSNGESINSESLFQAYQTTVVPPVATHVANTEVTA
jgi:hypothetical protein